MTKKIIFRTCLTFLLTFFFVQGAMAAGEVEVVLERNNTSITPIYMSGHMGDSNWIEGFSSAADIYLGNVKVGTSSGTITFSNPPMIVGERYGNLIIHFTNTITGVGTYEVTGQGISLASSTTTTAGDTTLAWTGSISNGTGGFSNIYGLSAGTGVSNVFEGGGTLKEVDRIRIGY